MRGAPNFAERKARARAQIIFSLDKIGSPAPRETRRLPASLTRPAPA
jgi:hypothetical protein